MSIKTLVDTGPMVALLKRDEEHHAWAVSVFKELPADGMATCEAVISEACFLMARWPAVIDALFRRLADGSLELVPLEAESDAIHGLMKKYRNLPASYADACLIRLSERNPKATVVTTDSDFSIYRRNKREALPLLSPW
ncbi:MAG: type II toxin-antitoxin system VapC family toxin [Myxococcota bacterium]